MGQCWAGLNLLADGYCSMAVIAASAHSIPQFSPVLEANGETDQFVYEKKFNLLPSTIAKVWITP